MAPVPITRRRLLPATYTFISSPLATAWSASFNASESRHWFSTRRSSMLRNKDDRLCMPAAAMSLGGTRAPYLTDRAPPAGQDEPPRKNRTAAHTQLGG